MEFQNNNTYPAISIKSNYITQYWKSVNTRKKKHFLDRNIGLPVSNRHTGQLSKKAVSRIKDRIGWLIYFAKTKKFKHPTKGTIGSFKVNFITLTLPSAQKHSDIIITKQCLNQLLTELRQRKELLNYVWRAELQKNGNIHYHILTDGYIHLGRLRSLWNRQLKKLGYIEAYRSRFKGMSFIDYNNLFKDRKGYGLEQTKRSYAFGKKTGWRQPNTTDIHSVYKIKNIGAYVSKYMAKEGKNEGMAKSGQEDKRYISSRLWACSTRLSQFEIGTLEYGFDLDELKELIFDNKRFRSLKDEFFHCVFVSIKELVKVMGAPIAAIIKERKKEVGYKAMSNLLVYA